MSMNDNNCNPDNECWPECSADAADRAKRFEELREIEELRAEDMARHIQSAQLGEAIMAMSATEPPWAHLRDPGTRHAAPRPTAPPLPVVTPPADEQASTPYDIPPPTHNLPEGVKSVLWVPVQQGDGSIIFQTTVEGFGYRATASSRSKMKALAYALENLAEQILSNAI